MKDQVNNQTLEGLIESLDHRGVLVLLVLLGQQSMKLLSEKHVAEVTKPNIFKPS
jgi:hypothetical protein